MRSDTRDQQKLDTVDLAQFTGTEQWHRNSINRTVLYTDGAQYVAQHGGAYWLLDEIALSFSPMIRNSLPRSRSANVRLHPPIKLASNEKRIPLCPARRQSLT